MSSSTWAAPIQRGRWIFNTIFHQGLAVVMMYTIWIPIDYRIFFPDLLIAHIILCTIGVIPLMMEALILFAGDNVWSQDLETKHRFLIHALLITTGSVLVIAGIAVEIGRSDKLTGHFESGHAIAGLISLMFICLALLMGLLSAFSKQLSGYLRPVILKFAHNLIGIITHIVGVVALCTGYYTQPFNLLSSEASRNTATVAAAILCFWSLIRALVSAVKNIRNIANIYSKKAMPLGSVGVNRPTSFIFLDQQLYDTPAERENL